MNVKWVTLNNGKWANLELVNLSGVETFGVYLIWNTNGEAVRVGQGKIAERLLSHREDWQILNHKANGLYVTWAAVPSHSADGVERYLYNSYSPLVGDRAPAVHPIVVNLP